MFFYSSVTLTKIKFNESKFIRYPQKNYIFSIKVILQEKNHKFFGLASILWSQFLCKIWLQPTEYQ